MKILVFIQFIMEDIRSINVRSYNSVCVTRQTETETDRQRQTETETDRQTESDLNFKSP